jgi:ABC-type phosphate transport system substrate-binding protein
MAKAALGWIALLGGLAAGLLPPATGADEASGFKVVVNASNPLTSVEVADLAQLFLKHATRWVSGAAAVPVDQPGNAPVRDRFSRQVLNRPAVAMEAYWAKQLFSGQATPPLTKPSDREVLAYVRDNPGAVGYVSADAPAENGTKVLPLTGGK